MFQHDNKPKDKCYGVSRPIPDLDPTENIKDAVSKEKPSNAEELWTVV